MPRDRRWDLEGASYPSSSRSSGGIATAAETLPRPCPANPTPSLCSASPRDATCGRDFRPPKFNSPGGSRKPSAGAGRAVAPGVPRLRGEVPEGRGVSWPPLAASLHSPELRPPSGHPGGASEVPESRAVAGPVLWTVVGQGRGSGFGAEVPGSRGAWVAHLRLRQSPAQPESGPGSWGGWVGGGSPGGCAVPRKVCRFSTGRLPFCKPLPYVSNAVYKVTQLSRAPASKLKLKNLG